MIGLEASNDFSVCCKLCFYARLDKKEQKPLYILQVETGIPPLAVAQLFRVLPNNTAGMEIHNNASGHFIT